MRIEDKIKKLEIPEPCDWENGDVDEILRDKLKRFVRKNEGGLITLGTIWVFLMFLVYLSLTGACTWGLPV